MWGGESCSPPFVVNEQLSPWSPLQPEEQISQRRGDGAEIRAEAIGDGKTSRHPAGGHIEIVVLLQSIAVGGGIRPEDFHAVSSASNDDEIGDARRLHHGNKAPKTTGDGIIAAYHCAARIRLADGAAYLISAARARSAATGNLIPVYGITLGGDRAGQGQEQQQIENCFVHNNLKHFVQFGCSQWPAPILTGPP